MEKQEKSERKNLNKEKKIIMKRNTKGITLIALVVTIIVLIILAGVSINLVFGNLGIVTKAKEAKRMQEQAELNEQIALGELSNEMDKEINGTGTQTQIKTVEELKNSGTYTTAPTTIKDSNGNLIKVPQGFKIAEDSGKNVTEGVVIEDNDIIEGIGNNRGNQYVWVPVGNKIKKSDGTTVDITLGRYTFADGTYDKDANDKVLKKGTPILKQSAENYTQEVLINLYYKELAIYRQGVASYKETDGLNTTSRGKKKADGTYEGIKSFIDSVKSNGGYYIARYEASYGTDGKANSKVSNNYIDSTTKPTVEGTLWNNITQLNAATACYDIYTTATTDLINSYAWDTAIVYIQNFSGDTEYSYQNGKSINSILANTGNNNDEKCKINDMASNTYEWTTEYSTNAYSSSAYPCTDRGGYYDFSLNYTSSRNSSNATYDSKNGTFRPTLYM